jgi:hypothetical protein
MLASHLALIHTDTLATLDPDVIHACWRRSSCWTIFTASSGRVKTVYVNMLHHTSTYLKYCCDFVDDGYDFTEPEDIYLTSWDMKKDRTWFFSWIFMKRTNKTSCRSGYVGYTLMCVDSFHIFILWFAKVYACDWCVSLTPHR